MRGQKVTDHNKPLVAPLIEHFRIVSICFARNHKAELRLPTFSLDERPTGSPLAEGEEVFVENETTLLVSVPTGEHHFNPSIYHPHQIVLAGDGPAEALAAVQSFVNASWLQNPEDTGFLENLLVNEYVNLREEGHAQREGDYIFFWAEMSYLDQGPQAKVLFSQFAAAVQINLKFLKQKATFFAQLAQRNIEHVDALPVDDELPQYQ
jgi:hypothetical protein